MLGNLDQIRSFVAAAECGSFSAAGRRLGKAQSVISTHIAMLEAELGLELFARAGRSPELSAPGRALLAEAREVLRQCGQFETLALALCDNPEAELRLALDEGLPYNEIGVLCADLAQRFAHLKVQLLHGSTIEVLRWVEREDAHLGVAYDEPAPDSAANAAPGSAPGFLGIERHWLGRVEQVLVAAQTHPLAALKRVSDRDLARHRQIVTRFALESGRTPYILSPSMWETNSAYAAADLALRGIGWAIVPVTVAGFGATPDAPEGVPHGLAVLDHDAGIPSLNIQMLRKAGRPVTPATHWIHQRLRELLRGKEPC